MELTTSIRYSGSTRAWNDLTDEVVDPVDPEVARQRHESGAEYGAVVPVGDVLAAVSMIGTEKVWVKFHGLPGTLFYAVDAVDGRLWLKEIQRRNGHGRYGKNGFPPSTCADFYRWPDPDSPARIARFDAETPKGRLLAERTEWDPEPNWFDWPDFGDYDALVDLNLLARVWPDAPPLPPSET